MDLSKLKKPFPASDIEWRVGSTNGDKTSGMALAYITNRAIMDRLDGVCGPENWRNEFVQWRGDSQLCGISIKVNDEWITKWDGADNSKTEATKGGLSDAMKRAGYQWGIGRYLYHLPTVWARIEPRGRSYVLSEIPGLPAWALPNGSGKPSPEEAEPKLTATSNGDSQGVPQGAGVVERIIEKSGTKNGKKWQRWGVTINGVTYGTFNENLADIAKDLEGKEADFKAEKNGKFWNLTDISGNIQVNTDDPEPLPF
jgi:hypothetical protein